MAGQLSKADAQDRLARIGIAPRGLPLDLAAAYVGLSPALFLAEVAAGRFPKPSRHGGSEKKAARRVWDMRALDEAMDRISGLVQGEAGAASLRAGAQEQDPIMAKINAARAQKTA